jgi:hypothetical protein
VSAERHEEPALLQALEQAQDALRTEQREQEPLSRENARLRARTEQLRAERNQLLRALEDPRPEQPPSASRRTEALVPPFTVQARMVPRQQVRGFLPAPVMMLLMLAVTWNQDSLARVFNLFLLLVVGVAQGVRFWLKRPRWRFDEADFQGRGLQGPWDPVLYSEVVDVEVHVSASQRRRGVGTVVVTYSSWPGKPAEMNLQLKDVPEPERLAAWLRAKRSDASTEAGTPGRRSASRPG